MSKESSESRREFHLSDQTGPLRELIATLAEDYLAIDQTLNPGEILQDPNYLDLSPEDRKTVLEWAVEKGYFKSDVLSGTVAPKIAETETAETPTTLDDLKAVITSNVEMAREIALEPDLSAIWTDPEYLALDDASRAMLHAWMTENDYGAPPDAPVLEESASPESSPPPESERKTPARKFVCYGFKKDAGGHWHVSETYEKRIGQTNDTEHVEIKTAIDIPDDLAKELERGDSSVLGDAYLNTCETIRNELDASGDEGLKLFFDGWDAKRKGKVDPKSIKPRWKYFLPDVDERQSDDGEVPEHILQLVIDHPKDYFTQKEYKEWYGKSLQEKREAIINKVVLKTPDEKPDAADEAPVSAPEIPVAASEKPPVIEEQRTTEPTAEELEKKFGKTYLALRARAEQTEDLAAFQKTLSMQIDNEAFKEQLVKKFGEDAPRDAARLLLEIERGMIGERSETLLDGIERTQNERDFFDAHPSLDRRNFTLLNDGTLIARLDPVHPDATIHRSLTALVNDALGGFHTDAQEQSLRQKIAVALEKEFAGNQQMLIRNLEALLEKIRVMRKYENMMKLP